MRKLRLSIHDIALNSFACFRSFPFPSSSLSFHRLQTLSHKLPLREAQPPLTRHIRAPLINPRQQSLCQLLSNLHQVLFQNLRVLAILWRLEHLVEWETWVAWNGEVGVERDVLNFFLRLSVYQGVSVFLITKLSATPAEGGGWKRRMESNENIIHNKHAHMSGVKSTSALSQKSTTQHRSSCVIIACVLRLPTLKSS